MAVKEGQRYVKVPNFVGMTRNEAADAAGKLGLYILTAGNPSANMKITVSYQEIAKDTLVPVGTTIRLEFADTAARD